MSGIVFPKLDWPPVNYDNFRDWKEFARARDRDMANLVRQLNQLLQHFRAPLDVGYSVGTFTVRKALPNTATATLAQLADFVATHTTSELTAGKLGS